MKMDILNLFPGFIELCLILTLSVCSVEAVYFCTTYRPYIRQEYCYNDQDCCGSYYNRYCCSSLTTGQVIGIGVGCLIGIVITIIVIVVCCNLMNKNRGRTGRVVYPNNGSGNVTVVNSSHQSHPTGFTGAPVPPPSYGQSAFPAQPGQAYPPAGPGQAYPPAGPGPAYPPAGPSQYPPYYSQTDPAQYPQKY
ncbi:protein shisa-4-like [Ostrea edulis]|uniref:protein shisa-4-like n=1 Tax=Ostrea edulis TaxID=37623 RepID=UPI0024AFE163|nr:protein shisa-4-like [Ostrea edulis]